MEEGVEFGFVPQQLPFAGHRMYSQGLVVGIAQCLCNNLEFAKCCNTLSGIDN